MTATVIVKPVSDLEILVSAETMTVLLIMVMAPMAMLAVIVLLLLLLLMMMMIKPPRITEGSVAVLTRPGVQTLEARNRLLS